MRDDAGRLQDILDAIRNIQKYAQRGRRVFETEELIQIWMVHNIQIIGEAACRLSREFTSRHSSIPWKDIVGMRNIIVHDYFGIDCDAVWQVVEKDIPELKRRIEQIVTADN